MLTKQQRKQKNIIQFLFFHNFNFIQFFLLFFLVFSCLSPQMESFVQFSSQCILFQSSFTNNSSSQTLQLAATGDRVRENLSKMSNVIRKKPQEEPTLCWRKPLLLTATLQFSLISSRLLSLAAEVIIICTYDSYKMSFCIVQQVTSEAFEVGIQFLLQSVGKS